MERIIYTNCTQNNQQPNINSKLANPNSKAKAKRRKFYIIVDKPQRQQRKSLHHHSSHPRKHIPIKHTTKKALAKPQHTPTRHILTHNHQINPPHNFTTPQNQKNLVYSSLFYTILFSIQSHLNPFTSFLSSPPSPHKSNLTPPQSKTQSAIQNRTPAPHHNLTTTTSPPQTRKTNLMRSNPTPHPIRHQLRRMTSNRIFRRRSSKKRTRQWLRREDTRFWLFFLLESGDRLGRLHGGGVGKLAGPLAGSGADF